MRLFLTAVMLTASVSSAQTATPAPLNGLWQLTSFSPLPEGRGTFGHPQMVISGNTVRGQLGCGTYVGSIHTTGHSVSISVTPQPPKANVRCLYALPGNFHAGLNAANHYLISEDTQSLILFSSKAKLTFKRIGYVTPAHT